MKEPSVDIVVCVHNALNEVKACLNSIIVNTNYKSYRIVIVDDGSDLTTRNYLNQFKLKHKQVHLLRNFSAKGYTTAANQGLKASRSQYVVLLNSDTIVSSNWLSKLVKCAQSNSKVGIVGPLSNAASWQSVPHLFGGENWNINQLPTGVDIEEMNRIIENIATKSYIDVPLLNGFCMLIKRNVVDSIGYFDDNTFPKGYGEEDDFCIRSVDYGYSLNVVSNCYIYHHKSRSFNNNIKKNLKEHAIRALNKKHGRQKVERKVHDVMNNQSLKDLREKIQSSL